MATVKVPDGLGKYYSYMNYDKITAPSSNQYQLRESAKANGSLSYTKEGYAQINGRQVVAVTSTFGNVGDYIDIKMKDGTTLNAVIGDIKNQADAGANKWGHNNGQVLVEYVTNWNDYHSNPKGNGGVVSVTNVGSYNGKTSSSGGTVWDIRDELDTKNLETYGFNSQTNENLSWLQKKGMKILKYIVSFIVFVFIVVVGVVYLLKAFDIDIKGMVF